MKIATGSCASKKEMEGNSGSLDDGLTFHKRLNRRIGLMYKFNDWNG